MIYRSIGVYGEKETLTIVFAEFHENAGAWNYEIKTLHAPVPDDALISVKEFIEKNNLQYQVALITLHINAAVFYSGGATIAAETGLPVITDLPAIDKALGGNGEFLNSAASKLNIEAKQMSEIGKAVCVAFMGVLRWREEYNFLSSTTGASRSSIGGALWMGQEA
jgi:hypothetical protein